jgi:propionyl-CoA carboxylase beta chain
MFRVRDLIPYLPLSNKEAVPYKTSSDPIQREDAALDDIIPSNSSIAYDMKEVVSRVIYI